MAHSAACRATFTVLYRPAGRCGQLFDICYRHLGSFFGRVSPTKVGGSMVFGAALLGPDPLRKQ